MRLPASIVSCGYLGVLGDPGRRSYHIFLISRLFNHLVKDGLEGSLLGRRLLTDIVGGVFRKTLRLNAESAAVELGVDGEAHFVGALGGAVGHFALGQQAIDGLVPDFPETIGSVDINALLSHYESREIRGRIDPKFRLSIAHESLVGPDGTGLHSDRL